MVEKNSYAARLADAMGTSFTVVTLGKAIGLTRQAVKKVLDGETAYFSVPNHFAVADALGVSARWLGIGEGPKARGDNVNGWPLSPELLAALQNTDPTKLKFVEDSARLALGLKINQEPMPETAGAA